MFQKKKLILYLQIFLLLMGTVCQAAPRDGARIKDARGDLSQLRVDAQKAQDELDSLRSAETRLVEKLNNLSERASLDHKMIKKLSAELSHLRQRAKTAQSDLSHRQSLGLDSENRLATQLRDSYLREFVVGLQSAPSILPRSSATAWRSVYDSALTSLREQELVAAHDSTEVAFSALKKVSASRSRVERLKKNRKVNVNLLESQRDKSHRNLTKVRQEKETLADRLLYLSAAAKQMNELVSRLEAQERRDRTGRETHQSSYTGLFVASKGRLRPPIAGKIISRFGWKTDEVSNLRSFSSGIEIRGKPNYNVRVVAPGVVVYTGSMRDYDNFVIVSHDDGYYTTYGGLGRIKVEIDQSVSLRQPVGVTASGQVKFEIRKGKDSVDPVVWLDFSSLH